MFGSIRLPDPGAWINTRLISEPVNWAIISLVASGWLLLFHIIMTAWQSATAGQTAFGAAPGQTVAPTTNAAGSFSAPGVLAGGATQVPGLFSGGGTPYFTDGSEAKYAEDGWTGNS